MYIAVTLLGQDDQGNPDFRQGYTNLTVDPSFEYLNVELTSQPERTGPGEPVRFDLQITDANGAARCRVNFHSRWWIRQCLPWLTPMPRISFSAFYGLQALNVRTGNSLAASGQRLRYHARWNGRWRGR